MISRFGFIIRNTIRISPENTVKLCKVLEREAWDEVERVKAEYEQKLKEMKEKCEKQIADIKAEPFESIIRRVAKEVVADEVKAKLTVEEGHVPYSGRDSSTWHLEWGGKEF